MKVIDLHCDTIDGLVRGKSNDLRKNELMVDLEKMQKGNSLAQTFALFVDISENKDPYKHFTKLYNKFSEELEKNKDIIELATSYKEIIENEKNNKMSAILSIEEGAVLEGKISRLEEVHKKGVRMITLTWNHENEIGYPNFEYKHKDKGLKPFGIELISKMNELGVLIDVSHLSDGGFYDVAKYSKKPFIATHSNARAITNHSRNLTDDMIKILANSGGITGINFLHAFLTDDYDKVLKQSRIEDMIRHIKHIYNVGGIDVIALGSDYDGITSNVEMKDISEIGKLADALQKEKFKIDDIEKIFYKNALRIMKQI